MISHNTEVFVPSTSTDIHNSLIPPSIPVIPFPLLSQQPTAQSQRINPDALSYTDSPLPVSNIFKRTCYKCGNLGHYAENCRHQERLCYNCKQPGHESANCPNPRNGELKQCYYCKKIGHVQADCLANGAGSSSPPSNNESRPPDYSRSASIGGASSNIITAQQKQMEYPLTMPHNAFNIKPEYNPNYYYYYPSLYQNNTNVNKANAMSYFQNNGTVCSLCGYPNHDEKSCYIYNSHYYLASPLPPMHQGFPIPYQQPINMSYNGNRRQTTQQKRKSS